MKLKVGYYFEVDLKYPEELHNKHKDLPYAPDKVLRRNGFTVINNHFLQKANQQNNTPERV